MSDVNKSNDKDQEDRKAEIAFAKQRPYFWFEDVKFEEWAMIEALMKPTHKLERYINMPEMLTRILYVREGDEPPEPTSKPLSDERLAEIKLARDKGGYVGFDDVEQHEVEWILHLMRDWDFDGDCTGGDSYSMYFAASDYAEEGLEGF